MKLEEFRPLKVYLFALKMKKNIGKLISEGTSYVSLIFNYKWLNS